ncbi:MAG: hypothetical protein ACMXYK_04255, partial [Candidatus Woesearchaeota archaeon]
MNYKLLSILMLSLVSFIPVSYGIYVEWPGISNWHLSPRGIEEGCSYTPIRDMDFVVNIPANTKIRLMIPRSYTYGFGNRMYHITANMSNPASMQLVDSINECPIIMPEQTAMDREPPGPYICVESPRGEEVFELIRFGSLTPEAGHLNADGIPSHPKFPGSVFDKNNEYSGMWPARSFFVINGFMAVRELLDIELEGERMALLESVGDAYVEQDCSGLEGSSLDSCNSNNANIQAERADALTSVAQAYDNMGLEVTTNSFPRRTLTYFGVKSNGREGIGDPWYLVIDIDNSRKRCSSNSCVENHFNTYGGFDPMGPHWESGLEGWESPEGGFDFEEDLGSVSNNYFDAWESDDVINLAAVIAGGVIGGVLYSFVDGSNFFKNIENLAKNILGLGSSSKCVFGCHDVTLEFSMTFGSRLNFAAGNLEYWKEDHSYALTGAVCDFHYDGASELDDFLEDGFRYTCDSRTNQFTRYNRRVVCDNYVVMSCDASLGLGTYVNPVQVYRDSERTKENFYDMFTWEDGGTIRYVSEFTPAHDDPDVPVDLFGLLGLYEEDGFEKIMSDFDPDNHREICMTQGCLADWLGESGMIQNENFGKLSTPQRRASRFLWKPISENDGRLVILHTPGMGPTSIHREDGSIIETGVARGPSNGYGNTVRFSRRGGEYTDAAYVSIGGSIFCDVTGNKAGRIESCVPYDPPSDEPEVEIPEGSNFNPYNLCCGDDPDDVGYIQNIQGHYFSCV